MPATRPPLFDKSKMGIHAPETGISIDINGYHISYQYQYKLSITNFKLSIINYQYRYHYQYQYQLSISIININIKLCFHTFLYFHTTITPTGKHSKLSCVKFETITRAKFTIIWFPHHLLKLLIKEKEKSCFPKLILDILTVFGNPLGDAF